MKNLKLKFSAIAALFAIYSGVKAQDYSPNDPWTHSDPCYPSPSTWFLGGNFIIQPPNWNPNMVSVNSNFIYDIGTCNDFPFVLKANNNRSVFIQPSGFVGINRVSPTAALEVASPGPVFQSSFKIFGDLAGNLESSTGINMNFASGSDMFFNTGTALSNTNLMIIKSNGNVGIGTTAPTEKLHVNGNGLFTGNVGVGITTAAERMHIASGNLRVDGNSMINGNEYVSGYVTLGITNGTGQERFHMGNGNMRIDGKLALNCVPSSFKVDIFDGTNSSLRLVTGSNNEAKVAVVNGLTGYDFKIRADGIGAISVGTGGIDLINFKSSGTSPFPQVWVGKRPVSNSPHQNDFLFAVDGKCVVKSLFVTNNGNWADYVFDKEYQLKSLSEVEEYIAKNKHLPNVPSAAELSEEYSLNVAEMQNIQMEKIEEIFLHLIELKKEITNLKEENLDLKKRLNNK